MRNGIECECGGDVKCRGGGGGGGVIVYCDVVNVQLRFNFSDEIIK